MENKIETTMVCGDYIGIMENEMETAIVRWGFIGILENKMETTHPKRCKISSVHGPWYGLAGSTLKPSRYSRRHFMIVHA